MRSSKSRSRSKSNRQRSLGNIVNRVFDSSGPEGKVRGTPQQIIDKYLALARDAQLGNDRVAEQAFLQHAEHYTRLLGEALRDLAREQEMRQGSPHGGPNGNGNGNGGSNGGGYSGDRGGEARDPRGQMPIDDDQPDFAPLGRFPREEASDEGPGLVETPEMYLAQEVSAPAGQGEPQGGNSGGRGRQRRGGERRDERKGDERKGGERPPQSEGRSTAQADGLIGGAIAPQPDSGPEQAPHEPRRERAPKGPRKPRVSKEAEAVTPADGSGGPGDAE